MSGLYLDGQNYSLTDLPLNILFEILSYLSLEDLIEVSGTSKLMKSLANECILYRNINCLEKICDGRHGQSLTNHHSERVAKLIKRYKLGVDKWNRTWNLSVIESVLNIQKKYNLDVTLIQRKLEQDLAKMFKLQKRVCKSEKLNNSTINRNLDLKQETEQLIENEELISSIEAHDDSFANSISSVESRIASKQLHSFDDSDFSKSPTNSVYSDSTARLLEASSATTSVYDLENNLTDFDHIMKKKKSLNQLRTSKKVREKAVLFEKLFSDEYRSATSGSIMSSSNPNNNTIISSNDVLNTIISRAPQLHIKSYKSKLNRKITQIYLNELKQVNSLDDSLQELSLKNNTKLNTTTKSTKRQLKAVIKDNNKISYESI